MKLGWERFEGEELRRLHVLQRYGEDFPPDIPAVYRWRLSVQPTRDAYRDSVACQTWLLRLLERPVGSVERVQLSHFLTAQGIILGGTGLSCEKVEVLAKVSRQEPLRRHLLDFIRSLESAIPPVYVGETTSLRRRVAEHLGGDTSFAMRLQMRESVLEWRDLYLEAYFLTHRSFATDDSTPREYRRLIEQIGAKLTIAGLTSRPG